MNALQGTKPAEKQRNDHLTCVLETLGTKQCASDYVVCMWYYDGYIIILNLSTDDVLVATSNPKARQVVNDALATHFQLTPNIDPTEFTYLNWRIIQSATHITMDQSDHIIKMCQSYFKGRTPPKYGIPFRTDSQVEDLC